MGIPIDGREVEYAYARNSPLEFNREIRFLQGSDDEGIEIYSIKYQHVVPITYDLYDINEEYLGQKTIEHKTDPTYSMDNFQTVIQRIATAIGGWILSDKHALSGYNG